MSSLLGRHLSIIISLHDLLHPPSHSWTNRGCPQFEAGGLLLLRTVDAHGHLTLPAGRNKGSTLLGGDCTNGACYWFSNNVEIPADMNATLPEEFHTVTNGGSPDVYSRSPWRAPGYAPIYGSGCGAAGGGPWVYHNGGTAPVCIKQNADLLVAVKAFASEKIPLYRIGGLMDVAFALSANHGGGYHYRLCKKDTEKEGESPVSERCFQQTPLKFAETSSYLINAAGKIFKQFPLTKTSVGTWPVGSEWARVPIPGCRMCADARQECGAPLPPKAANESGGKYNDAWNQQVNCYARCSGSTASKPDGRCPLGTEFYEALAGKSGFSKEVPKWSVLDRVRIPAGLAEGDYLLSWRWDCEESTQVRIFLSRHRSIASSHQIDVVV